jgi:hypothetical protein
MITQCPQSPKTGQASGIGRAGLRKQEFGPCGAGSPAIASRPTHQYAPEIRPNADSTINPLTLGTASFLLVANRTALERRGLAASRRLESWMQLLEMT